LPNRQLSCSLYSMVPEYPLCFNVPMICSILTCLMKEIPGLASLHSFV
jgi:hypothetical protein